jgi:hypothetical protein
MPSDLALDGSRDIIENCVYAQWREEPVGGIRNKEAAD